MNDDDDFAVSESNMSKSFFGTQVGHSFQSAGGNQKPKNLSLAGHNVTSTALPGAILSAGSKANPLTINSAKSSNSPVDVNTGWTTTAKTIPQVAEKADEEEDSEYAEDPDFD